MMFTGISKQNLHKRVAQGIEAATGSPLGSKKQKVVNRFLQAFLELNNEHELAQFIEHHKSLNLTQSNVIAPCFHCCNDGKGDHPITSKTTDKTEWLICSECGRKQIKAHWNNPFAPYYDKSFPSFDIFVLAANGSLSGFKTDFSRVNPSLSITTLSRDELGNVSKETKTGSVHCFSNVQWNDCTFLTCFLKLKRQLIQTKDVLEYVTLTDSQGERQLSDFGTRMKAITPYV